MTVALRRSWAKDLDAATLYELLKLRVEVFVVEQAIPYPELDGRDLCAETRHFWLEGPDGEVISTLRLMEEHPGGQKGFRIGRVCTKRTARGHGHTDRLLQAALAEVGDYPCRINSQTYLAEMYSHARLRPRRRGIPRRRHPACADGQGRVAHRSRAAVTPGYPFSAIVGHDRLRLALLLCAVRPEIGGVLIRGEKGTAKSTAVRALAHVLAAVDGDVRLVELPIGATEDRVVGSLDLQKVLRDGEHAFSPGLLARAHGGVLYVDEVNLLHDHLVDVHARRRRDGPGARRARRRLAQPRGAIRADRHDEPRRGRTAAAAARPVRADRRRARLPRRRRPRRGDPAADGVRSRSRPASPSDMPRRTPSWRVASPRRALRSALCRCRTTSYGASRRCARRSTSTGCGPIWWWRARPSRTPHGVAQMQCGRGHPGGRGTRAAAPASPRPVRRPGAGPRPARRGDGSGRGIRRRARAGTGARPPGWRRIDSTDSESHCAAT